MVPEIGRSSCSSTSSIEAAGRPLTAWPLVSGDGMPPFAVAADSDAFMGHALRAGAAAIFGAGQPSEDQVREYWDIVDGSLKELTGTLGFWGRQRARFSPRSLLADGRAAISLRGLKPTLPGLKELRLWETPEYCVAYRE